MKKIVIILSAILLTLGVKANTQDPQTPLATSDQQQEKPITSTTRTTSSNVSSVTLDRQEITLYVDGEAQKLNPTVNPIKADNQGIDWSNSSNGTISKVDNGVVSAVSVGIDTVYATSQIDTKKIAKCIIEVKVDSLVWFRSHYMELSAELQNNSGKVIAVQQGDKGVIKVMYSQPEKGGLLPDFVFYILGALVIILNAFLFLLNKKRNKVIAHYKDRKEHYKSKSADLENEKGSLFSGKSNLSAEIEKLKDENIKLRTEIYQNQQKQKSNDEPKPQLVAQPQSLSLYADAIIDGKFNRVTEEPDSRSIFELKLAKAHDTRATVIVYPAAYSRIIANPSFMEGCEKQVLGNTVVTIIHEGIAQKDSSGKWSLITIPRIKIS